MTADLPRRLTAETIGTAMLLAAVVGSGIMADRLSNGNGAIALLANAVATAAALVALILTYGPVSGAHFNPAVSFAETSQGGLRWQDVPAYVVLFRWLVPSLSRSPEGVVVPRSEASAS